jgi:hypothetical protein
MNKTPPVLQRMIDLLVKTVVVLISFLVTIWFFTKYNTPGAGRSVIYASLLIPVAVFIVYQATTLAIRRLLFHRRMRRISDLPLAEQMAQLGRLVEEQKRLLEREHPEIEQQLRKQESDLASVLARAEAIKADADADPQVARAEAKKVFDELVRLTQIEQSKPNAALQGTRADTPARRP